MKLHKYEKTKGSSECLYCQGWGFLEIKGGINNNINPLYVDGNVATIPASATIYPCNYCGGGGSRRKSR